jgi:dTDP-4-dehydrorhamnose reductase
MKIIITGANGMVARAVIEDCRELGDEVVACSRKDLDISDAEKTLSVIRSEQPDAVINCAAYTDVDGAESNEAASNEANAYGVENLANACKAADARFVTISTDYVFDGTNLGFYTQRDTPNPQGLYARSKLEGEIRARYAYARSVIVRSGWIYGSGGTNFLSKIPSLLSEGRPMKAISDAYGTPTYAHDLAKRLRELVELDIPGIFHVVNAGEGTTYLGFAEAACDIGGYDLSLIESVSGSALTRPAPRPVSSKMACVLSRAIGLEPLPEWNTALRNFIELK